MHLVVRPLAGPDIPRAQTPPGAAAGKDQRPAPKSNKKRGMPPPAPPQTPKTAGICHHERLAQGDRVGAERAAERQLASAPNRLLQLLQPACALEKEAVRIYQRYQRGRRREELTAELCQAIVAHFGRRVEQCGPPQRPQPICVAGACHKVGGPIRSRPPRAPPAIPPGRAPPVPA